MILVVVSEFVMLCILCNCVFLAYSVKQHEKLNLNKKLDTIISIPSMVCRQKLKDWSGVGVWIQGVTSGTVECGV